MGCGEFVGIIAALKQTIRRDDFGSFVSHRCWAYSRMKTINRKFKTNHI